jgi:hypothetical protein
VGRATEGATTVPSSVPLATPAVSLVAADFATRLARVGNEAFPSMGHAGGRYAATVYVSPEAREAFLEGKALAPGSEVVMATVDRASKAHGPSFFMKKDTNDVWRFGVVESPGAKPEEVALCARCHVEAPHDSLFALP